MASQLLEVFDVKNNQLLPMLEDLIHRYPQINDPERMDLAKKILNTINQLMEWEESFFCENDDIRAVIPSPLAELHRSQERLSEVVEKMIMVHVDEPDATFLDALKDLHRLLEEHYQVIRGSFIPSLEKTYDPEKLHQLEKQVSQGMMLQKN